MSGPWAKVSSPQSSKATSLRDVMNEQAIESTQNEDDDLAKAIAESLKIAENEKSVQDAFASDLDKSTDCTSDAYLARLLQQEFDAEYATTATSPKHVPVTIVNSDSDIDDELEDRDEQRDYIRSVERAINVGQRGFANIGGQIITKHDPDLCGHKNTQKITDNLPVSFPCGDAHTSNQPISNKIYNQLRKSAYKDQKRKQRHNEAKEKSTAEKAVDENTRIILQKVINVELVESYGGIVAAGKEAIVIHATGGTLKPFQADKRISILSETIPAEMAVKVFKTTLNEFKSRDKYIQDDYRFKDRFKKMNPRKMIRMWCEKELFNLKLLRDAGVLCPEPVCIKKHILFMRFIGDQGIPAPRLARAEVTKQKTRLDIMTQVIDVMIKMWKSAGIIHADFSEFNILYFQRQIWVIDVSQAVTRDHPFALDFLLRDCRSINRFFTKQWGLAETPTVEELFNKVTGFGFGSPDIDSDKPDLPLDDIRFHDELEAAKLELQRRNNLQRNQFNSEFGLGADDDFHEELAECDQDEYIDFLNHLSNMNASACDPEIEVSSSEDEEDEDPEESAELRLTTSQTAVEE